ncbi:MAG: hypothetical protein HY606_15475 [Planctomycetes bacterium]|nr:hypothetical protein [Planctomycetota bacterium]
MVNGIDNAFVALLSSINRQSNAINRTLSVLSTGRAINSSSDRVLTSILESELQPLSTAIERTQNAINLVDTADAALGEVSGLLNDLQSVTVRSLGVTTTEQREVLQEQAQQILSSIDRIQSQTRFGDTRIFSNPFQITDKSSEITDVRLTQTSASLPSTVSVSVVESATRASATGTIAATQSADATFKISGPQGTATISVSAGATRESIVEQINNFTDQTGVEATDSGGIRTVKFGSDASVNIQFVEGTLEGITQGVSTGTDVNATIDGASVQGRGNTVAFNAPNVSGQITFEEDQTGTFSFRVVGGGFATQIGPIPNDAGAIRFQIPEVSTATLGNTSNIGSLSSIAGGGANSLISNPTNALTIINSAAREVSTGRSQIGSLSSNLLQRNVENLDKLTLTLTRTTSSLKDADVAEELTRLMRLRVSNNLSLGLLASVQEKLPNLTGFLNFKV